MDANIKIGTRFGFGTEFVGSAFGDGFRNESGRGLYSPDTYAKYLFVVVFCVPLFPIGCFRIKKAYYQEIATIYSKECIIGREKPMVSELIGIYIREILFSPIKLLMWPIVVIQSIADK